MRKITLVILALWLGGCTSVDYQRPVPNRWNGYLDKQIGENLYVIEVQSGLGYRSSSTMTELRTNFKRRAAELCPYGYEEKTKVIRPIEAYFEEFKCNLVWCQEYAMVSGVVNCKGKSQ